MYKGTLFQIIQIACEGEFCWVQFWFHGFWGCPSLGTMQKLSILLNIKFKFQNTACTTFLYPIWYFLSSLSPVLQSHRLLFCSLTTHFIFFTELFSFPQPVPWVSTSCYPDLILNITPQGRTSWPPATLDHIILPCDGKFYVSTWLDHRMTRYLVKHYSGHLCEVVLEWD